MKSFQEALRVDGNHVEALIGAAQVDAGMNPPAASAALERALKMNPNSVPAHLLRRRSRSTIAARRCPRDHQEGAVGQSEQPRGAVARRRHRTFSKGQQPNSRRRSQEILKINPNYGEVYRVAGDHAARNYRFDEAVGARRDARSLDPDNTRAYADLGHAPAANRRRDRAPAVALERAFKGDRVRPDDLQSARPARHDRQVRDDHRRRHHHAPRPRRSRRDARVRDAAGQGSACDAAEAVQLQGRPDRS